MKIHKITLKDYNQFKDLEIDLTYPNGHPKAGQPLDKVCFIGQSGTGKTSLLRLIKYLVTGDREIGKDVSLNKLKENSVIMLMSFDNYIFTITAEDTLLVTIKDTDFNKWLDDRNKYIESYKPILVNFPTERLNAVNNLNLHTNLEISEDVKTERLNYLENLEPELSLDFAFEDSAKAWEFVLSDIKKYQASDLEWRNTIAETVLNSNTVLSDFEKINQEYQSWLKKNPNPLEKLAAAMNEVLKDLGVKIKTDIDKESILHLGSILLQTLDGVTLERNFWSTGTKQIVDTLMPLIELKPKNAVILIDEPERSLYPNMQQKIIDLYTAQSTNCQFFFATHSPIIASSFDPWEIVELKFDNTHMNIVQETNYTGERHINNYTVYPKYLRWDGILMKLFDLTDEGNTDHRMEKLMEAVSLKRKLNKLKEKGENKGEKFDTMLEEFIKIKSQVGWDEKD